MCINKGISGRLLSENVICDLRSCFVISPNKQFYILNLLNFERGK